MTRTRSVQVRSHQHKTYDIKPLGQCRACDDYYERRGLTSEEVEAAFHTSEPAGSLRLLRIMGDIDPVKHAQYVEWIGQGVALSEAVDEAMGDWPK